MCVCAFASLALPFGDYFSFRPLCRCFEISFFGRSNAPVRDWVWVCVSEYLYVPRIPSPTIVRFMCVYRFCLQQLQSRRWIVTEPNPTQNFWIAVRLDGVAIKFVFFLFVLFLLPRPVSARCGRRVRCSWAMWFGAVRCTPNNVIKMEPRRAAPNVISAWIVLLCVCECSGYKSTRIIYRWRTHTKRNQK